MEDSGIPHQAIQWELSRATRESRDGMAKEKLDGHHQTRSEGHEGHGHYLG